MPPDQKKLSIAFMNSIPADVFRGGEKWMVTVAAGLAERGHTVVCIGRRRAVWLEKAAGSGIETLELPIHGDLGPFIIARLVSFFRKRRIDVLCCNFEKDLRLGGVAGRIAKVKNIFVRKGLALISDALRYRLTYRHIADAVITPTAFIKKKFAAFPWLDQGRIHVVPNGVEVFDTARCDRGKLRRIAGVRPQEPLVLGAGTIFFQKGFEYFVEALSVLHRRGVAVHGAIAGEGDRDGIAALAGRLGIAPFVHLLGRRDDLPELMCGADVFVQSSIDEGMPNVVLEAMSIGTPVVASDAGGTSEIITDGRNGFIVPMKNAPALAEKVELLVKDKILRTKIGQEGRSTAQERFSIPRMVERVEELFRNAAGRQGRRP